MKIYHFALLFLLFFIGIVIKTDLSIGDLKAVENEKKELSISLDSATSDAINYLAASGTFGTNEINKEGVINTFFSSLYSSMDIISDPVAQTEVELYIPVILLCDTDGYYIYYYEDYIDGDGMHYANRQWSEKIPYCFEDDLFSYRFSLYDIISIYDKNNILKSNSQVIEINYHEMQVEDGYAEFRNKYPGSFLLDDEKFELAKKGAIINQLEEALSYYTTMHNVIAKNNGISYAFSFPADQEEWASYIDDVSLLVVFQGYPYGVSRNYTFNKIASSGANIIKKGIYFIEQKSWYYLIHRDGCEKLKVSTTVLDETFESIEECAKLGAYCCECIEHGARVPVLK